MMLLACALLLVAAPGGDDVRFESFAQKYIEELLDRQPETATRLGEHKNDARLNDYSAKGVQRDLAAAKGGLGDLTLIDPANLSSENSVDYRILRHRLEAEVYELETLRDWQWNPLEYNVGRAIYALVSRDFAPPEQRLRSVIGRLNGIPAVVAAAKANLKSPPKVHTETAIQQNKGTIKLVKEQLEALVKQAPGLEKEFRPAQRKALAALAEYQRWLEKDLLPRSTGDFRIGAYLDRAPWELSDEKPVTARVLIAFPESRRVIGERLGKVVKALTDDGGTEFEFQVRSADAFVRWLLPLGQQVEVISPAAIKQQVKEARARLRALYR